MVNPYFSSAMRRYCLRRVVVVTDSLLKVGGIAMHDIANGLARLFLTECEWQVGHGQTAFQDFLGIGVHRQTH